MQPAAGSPLSKAPETTGASGAFETEVVAWLDAHPAFLADHPQLYARLDPPRRVHGQNMADHMQAMVAQARTRANRAETTGAQAAAGRRATEGFARRVQSTVLALMRAPDPAWLAIHELAPLLQVDAARLCTERDHPASTAIGTADHVAALPRGTIAAALGQRPALVRAATPDPLLHGEAVALATAEALVRVPLRTGPALLAIACRDPAGLEGATTDTLGFLGQAIAAALDMPAGPGAGPDLTPEAAAPAGQDLGPQLGPQQDDRP